MEFQKKIKKFVLNEHLIDRGTTVLAGFSGGADSCALVAVLSDLRLEIGFHLHAVHVNHHLRAGAGRDAIFAKKFCEARQISFSAVDIHLKKKLKAGGSVEEIAREERFKALIATAKKIKADRIALGHHQDDLAETVLLRLLRGTGLQGLQAILPKRAIYGHIFIRPLLSISRDDIEKYLKDQAIVPREDPTNAKNHFLRNKIRHHLLPLIKKAYQSNITELLCNLSFTSADDYEYLRSKGEELFKAATVKKTSQSLSLDINKLSSAHSALIRMCIRLALEDCKGNTNQITLGHLREIEALLHDRPEGTVAHLAEGIRVKKSCQRITIRSGKA